MGLGRRRSALWSLLVSTARVGRIRTDNTERSLHGACGPRQARRNDSEGWLAATPACGRWTKSAHQTDIRGMLQ